MDYETNIVDTKNVVQTKETLSTIHLTHYGDTNLAPKCTYAKKLKNWTYVALDARTLDAVYTADAAVTEDRRCTQRAWSCRKGESMYIVSVPS